MSELESFLVTTGRTLAQMALYSPDHPTVKGAVQESHRLLTIILKDQPELSLSIHENKLLVNGNPQEEVAEGTLKPFVQLLETFNLHSLSFLPGLSPNELLPFFNLAYRNDLKKQKVDVADYMTSNKVDHIKVNQVKYEKMGEDETVGGKGEGEAGAGTSDTQFRQAMDKLPLDKFMAELVKKAVKDPNERRNLFQRVSELIKSQIEQIVEKQTKELRAEKQMVTNERERTENVVENMADGVVVVDEHGNVLMMNQAAEDIYGVKMGKCVGRPLWEGVKKEQMVALAKDLTVSREKPYTKEVNLKADEDTQKTLRASTAAVQDPNGRVVGMVSVLSDVTKQRELTRLQNEFMANVTHDLRAPIHALKLAVAAILEEAAGPVTAEQKKMLNMATRNVSRLSRLIDDLLDFSQIESGKMRINPQIVQLSPVLQEAVSSLESWAKSRSVQVKYEEQGKLAPVYADTDRILQVVNNLLSNAIKFTPPQGTITLRTSDINEGGQRRVKIEVEDTGKGITKEDQKRIFERFIQLQNKEKLDIRGTGLGLSICQSLIDQHKGKLSVISPLPDGRQGSNFWFSLPTVDRSQKRKVEKPEEKTLQPKVTPKKTFWKKILSKLKFSVLLVLLCAPLLEARPNLGRVRRALGGDRLQLENGTVVKYLGIRAPDMGTPAYAESVAANKAWVERKEVRFRYGLQERDADGTWLAYVFVDGVFVNLELVREGMALVARLKGDEEYLRDLLKAETKARRKKRGLWKDSVIDDYPVRNNRGKKVPWATSEEIKKGIKK